MATKPESLLRWRIWMLLSATFLALGAVAVLSVSRLALQRYQSDFSANLLTSAQLLANSLSVGPETQLDSVHKIIPELKAAYVIEDDHGVPTARVYGENADNYNPSPLEMAAAHTVLDTHNAIVEPDRTGFFRAYVPVRNRAGKPTRVLVVIEGSSGLATRSAAVSTGILWSLLVTILLGLLFAQILASYLTPLLSKDGVGPTTLALTRLIKGTLLELTLAVLSAVVIGAAAFGFLVGRDLDHQATVALQSISTLNAFRTRLISAMATGFADEEATSDLHRLAINADLDWPYESTTLTTGKLAELGQMAGDTLRRQSLGFDALEDSANTRSQTLLVVFAVASFLALGAIVLLRTARRQERELASAREDIARQEAAYKHIADNLPIGFYTYKNQQISNSNPAWDRMVGREPSQADRWQVFISRIHPEDRVRVTAAFERASLDLNPFGAACRLVLPEGTVRHVETRAVAVRTEEGGLEHIVGFLVDISSRVRAQRLLEDKNREIQDSNDMLRKAVEDIEDNFEAMVHSLVKAVEAKDPYTAGHSERVMAYSLRIGERLGLSPDDLRILKMGTLIHDIGKIGIPDAILTKPSHLSEEEYEMIKLHPMLGYKMVEHIPTFSDCLPIVLHHHERLDGNGYPLGLRGLEIPLLVRICSVSDCFDAMTSDRAYRRGLDPEAAIEELLLASDRKIVDRHLVEVLADLIVREGLTSVASPR